MKSSHIKSTLISKPPKVLVVSLQRVIFSMGIKNHNVVNFKVNLNLDAYVDSKVYSKRVNYELKSIINHKGNLKSGHYTSTVKIKTKWYEFDDNKISECKYIPEKSNEAYTFFYVLKT